MTTFIRYLRVFLHQPDGTRAPIGYMSQYGDILRLSFDNDYIENSRRPTLSLAYVGETEAQTRTILSANRDLRLVNSGGRLPPYFANLLPEAHNRTRLANQRGCDEDDEFELLAAAGHDLLGAIEVEPASMGDPIPDEVRLWHATQGLDVLEPGFVDTPVEDGASLPGVVTKFSAIQDGRRYLVKRHGEAGDTILKLPSTRHPDLVANEFAGYQLCNAVGLDCAEAEVISREAAELPEKVPFNDILAVKRFDRGPAGKRIHVEEFAQAINIMPRRKYGKGLGIDYPLLIRALDVYSPNRVQDIEEFIRRVATFVLMGAVDMHLKNWAFIYRDGRSPNLAPIYDPVCITAYFEDAEANYYTLNRSIDAEMQKLTFDDIEGLLTRAGINRAGTYVRKAREVVQHAQAVWPALLKDVPGNMAKSIRERLDGKVALASGYRH